MIRSPYLLLTLTALFWSGNFIAARAFLPEIGAITLSFYRWLFVAVILLPWLFRAIKKSPLVKPNWTQMMIMAFLSVTCFNTLVYIGLSSTFAANGLLINSMIPFSIVFMNLLIFKVRISQREVSGIMVSAVGVLWIVSHGSINRLIHLDINQGDTWIIGAAVCWGLYSVLLKNWRPKGWTTLEFLAIMVYPGLLMIGAVYLINPFNEAPMIWTMDKFLIVAYVSIFASLLAYVFYIHGIEQLGPDKGGQFIHLMPILGSFLAWLIIDESIFSYHLIGGVLIFMGLMVSNKLSLKLAKSS